MTVFVDTSAFYSALDQSDIHHSKARDTWLVLAEQGANFVTTSYALLETVALVQSRLGMSAARAFQEEFYPIISITWISEAEHRPAMEAMLQSGRRKLSLVDCVSFQVMRSHGVRTAFCFDGHFREQGFSVKP
jgi:predicted nucleic acid-binding protein